MAGGYDESDLRRVSGRAMGRRRFLHLGVTAVSGMAFVSLLAACGGDDDDVEEPTGSSGSGSGSEATTLATATEAAGDATTEATQEGAAEAPQDKTVIISQGIDIKTFDPHYDGAPTAFAVYRNVFSNLVARDENLEFQPQLAETWEIVDDLTWEFKLREDVVFHDGSPFTSKDMEFSFQNLFESTQASRVAMIDRLEAPDDYTFRIITKQPSPAFLTVIHYCWALPAETYTTMGAEAFSLAPVGSGPYRVVEWVKDQHILLEAVEDHWMGPVVMQKAEFRPIGEASTRVAALLAGEVHIASLIPATDVPVVNDNDGTEIRTVQSLRNIFIQISCFNPPFDDVRVRQAMNYGVNVQAIIDNVLGGHGFRTASVSGPSEFGFNPDVEPYPYDLERARQLMAEAGHADGFDAVLDTPQSRYLQDVEVAQAVGGELANIGINVEVRPSEFQALLERNRAGEIEHMVLLGWGATAIHADGVMGAHIDSARLGQYYNSPKSDAMIHEAAAEFDEERALEIYHELMQYLHDEAPWIFLYTQEDIYGVASDLEWQPVPNELIDVYRMRWTQ